MTLYEIGAEINELLENGFNENCIDEETGEIDEVKAQEYLNELNLSFDEKIDDITSYIKDLRARSNAIKEETKRLTMREKSITNKADSLENYISGCLLAAKRTKFETTRNVISFRKSLKVNILDEAIIPQAFMIALTSYKPDKKAIKEAIKEGELVDGAELKEVMNIQIN